MFVNLLIFSFKKRVYKEYKIFYIYIYIVQNGKFLKSLKN